MQDAHIRSGARQAPGQKRTLAKDRYGYSVAAAGYCGVAKAPLAMAACTLLVTGTEQG